MNTLIFRTMAPIFTVLMLLFSIIVLLRGHNDPGGGFIGGLIAASAMAIHGMAFGGNAVRKLLRLHPISWAGLGVLIAALSGLLSLFTASPFLTGLWLPAYVFGVPGLFDIGVYLTVFGTLAAIDVALEHDLEND